MTDNESRQKSKARKIWFQPRAADCKLLSDGRNRWADGRKQPVPQLWSGWMRRCSWRSTRGNKKKKRLVRSSLSKRARQRQTGLPDGEGCYHRDLSGANLENQMFTQIVHNSEFNVKWSRQTLSSSRILSFELFTCSHLELISVWASLWCENVGFTKIKVPSKVEPDWSIRHANDNSGYWPITDILRWVYILSNMLWYGSVFV